MACETFESRISEYLERTLPASELRAVEDHLAVCAACRTFADQLRQLDAVLVQGIKAPAISSDFNLRLQRRLQSEAATVSESQWAARRRELQAEYASRRRQLRKQQLGFSRLLEVLVYSLVCGFAAWMLLELKTMTPGLTQILLSSGVAGVGCLALGWFTVRLRYRPSGFGI